MPKNTHLCWTCRFGTVAYLQQIWWFEVDGEIEFYFPPSTYALYFRLHLGRSSKSFGRRICNLDQVHGWDIKPARFQLSTSNCGSQDIDIRRYIATPGTWLNYYVGEFVVTDSDIITKVKFSMTQIDCTHTKGGLCLDSVLICPKGYNPNWYFIYYTSHVILSFGIEKDLRSIERS